jgi:hypothetical protein
VLGVGGWRGGARRPGSGRAWPRRTVLAPPNQLRIEVTRSGHCNPWFKEASQRCVRVYRVVLQREGGEGGKRRDDRAERTPYGQEVAPP